MKPFPVDLAGNHGQDAIEYALMTAYLAVAGGAFMPGVPSAISKVLSTAPPFSGSNKSRK